MGSTNFLNVNENMGVCMLFEYWFIRSEISVCVRACGGHTNFFLLIIMVLAIKKFGFFKEYNKDS